MKDLVDHIRTVHFTVFVVALVLTIALQKHKKPQLDRAAADAEAILLLEQRWPIVTNALSKAVDDALNHSITVTSGVERTTRTLEIAEPGRYKIKGHSVYPDRSLIFQVPRKWIYVDQTLQDENPGWGESEEFIERLPTKWTNLKEFSSFWDGFHDGQRAFAKLEMGTSDSQKHCGDVDRIPDSERSMPTTAFLVLRPKFERNWQLAYDLEGMDRDPNKHKHACEFPAVYVSSWIPDLAAVFSEVVPQAKNWGKNQSATEFRDLIAESKYFQELPAAALAGVLREHANAETDMVELFQAKFPVEAIATYGALVLVICQLYLLAHLLELRRVAPKSERTDWPTGYIGLYENPLLSIFMFVSLVAWPPFPLLLLALTPSDNFSRFYRWGAFAVSMAVAISSAKVLESVRKE